MSDKTVPRAVSVEAAREAVEMARDGMEAYRLLASIEGDPVLQKENEGHAAIFAVVGRLGESVISLYEELRVTTESLKRLQRSLDENTPLCPRCGEYHWEICPLLQQDGS